MLLLLACTSDELSQAWEIDRLRVLAVAAEPAEPRPGDHVTFSSLVVSPDPIAAVVWTVCADPESDEFGCAASFDTTALSDDPGSFDVEDFEAAGGIGIEPYFAPEWEVPVDLLDDLDADARLEGVTSLINLVAVPEAEELDESDLEIAFKRVPVSEAPTPNHNPTLTGFRIDGNEIPAGAVAALAAGQTYEIEPILAEDAVETYTYRTQDGEDEEREEEPYLSWYLVEGTFDQPNSLYPYLSVNYTAPEEPAADEGSLWVAIRDRRGGMGWIHQPIRYY